MREKKIIIHKYPDEKPTEGKEYLIWLASGVRLLTTYAPTADIWNAHTTIDGTLYYKNAFRDVEYWAEIPEV